MYLTLHTHLLCGPSMSLVTFRCTAALARCQFRIALFLPVLLCGSLPSVWWLFRPAIEIFFLFLCFPPWSPSAQATIKLFQEQCLVRHKADLYQLALSSDTDYLHLLNGYLLQSHWFANCPATLSSYQYSINLMLNKPTKQSFVLYLTPDYTGQKSLLTWVQLWC